MPRKNGGYGPRCVALVGPFGGGKTTLLESILWVTGAIQRKGTVPTKNTVGDAAALFEAAFRYGNSARALRQQDRQGERLDPRNPRDPSGGLTEAIGAAPDSDLEERHRDGLCRFG